MAQGRNWCFTLNNPTQEDVDRLTESLSSELSLRYAVWQRERGERGTEHLQGYVEFKKVFRLAAVKRVLGSVRVHVEPRRGSRDQARDYCLKDESSLGGRVELGQFEQRRGQRLDIEAFRDAIVSGAGDGDLLREHTAAYFKYAGVLQRARVAIRGRVERAVSFIVCCGLTGSGKSHYAWNFAGDMEKVYCLFSKKPLWFDGYHNEPVLFIDEWEEEPGDEELKRICDKWPYMGPVKGGAICAQWTTVILATNHCKGMLENTWSPALLRRVTMWREYRGRDSVTVTEVA